MPFNREFHGPNLAYIFDLYERYREDPLSLDENTRQFFATWKPASDVEDLQPGSDLAEVNQVADLAQAIRSYGYLAAQLDPLGSSPPGDPSLQPDFHGLDEGHLFRLPGSLVGLPGDRFEDDAYQAIEALRSIYCGTIGYDYGDIRIPEERAWLRHAAESGRFRPPEYPVDPVGLLERLSQVEAFESFLHHIYPGKTRFSIEGLDILVPMLDETVRAAAKEGICVILIGMAHRGRLNVLSHVLRKPYDQILAEFKDPQGRATTWDELGWTGDVKYHLGAHKSPGNDDGIDLVIHLPPNPSHLEHIDPVILGMARAANSAVDKPGAVRLFQKSSLPILIHGDAAITGQGIVSETLNFSLLPGYHTSGTLHIIANNQLGFTTTERESRSSLHASDIAKGFKIPVIHVNADDPVACLEAVRTAFAYRLEFKKDFVINLIGYRRYGHNEGDEPRFTQPLMYRKIDSHPPIRQQWASRLVSEGVIKPDIPEAVLHNYMHALQEVNQSLDAEESIAEPVPSPPPRGAARKVKTSVPLERLRALNKALLQFPPDFNLNPKLKKAVQRRLETLSDPEGAGVDWATAEELAFATILEDGIAIRLSGQDTARGTFSQRYAIFHDTVTNDVHIPLQSFTQARASFEVINSPLSEAAALGFEFGYNAGASDRLVLWEAQYGDFINVAQAIVDEFILSGRAKWGLTPSLVLLLPHGNEGQGPDHSSARLERFLGLAAEDNLRLAIPTTAAQYFHLLRRQALLLKTDPLPLIVLTPKGLLRHPIVASQPRQLAEGNWQPVLTDPTYEPGDSRVKTLILCSGRIYVDLVTSEKRRGNKNVALTRLEQIYPLPEEALNELLASYSELERVLWVQEEPQNMGAWDYLRPRLRNMLKEGISLHSVARPESSSPAEGSTTIYRLNQEALIRQAFNIEEQSRSQSVVIERG